MFKKSKDAENVKHEVWLGHSNFKPTAEALAQASDLGWTGDLRERYLTLEALDILEKSGHSVPDFPLSAKYVFSPGSKKAKLISLFKSEFEMYQFHYRDTGKTSPPTAFVHNMIHSVSQQCLSQDHGLYLVALAGRKDDNPRLIAYPEVPICPGIGAHNVVNFTKADIEDDQKAKSTRDPGSRVAPMASRILDYHFIPVSQAPIGHVSGYSTSHLHIDIVTNKKSNKRFHAINPGKKGAISKYAQHAQTGDSLFRSLGNDTPSFSLLTRQGFVLRLATGTERKDVTGFVAFSNNYTAVVDEHSLENGVSIDELMLSVLRLQHPPVPRWEVKSETCAPFSAAVSVTGLGPLSDALVGRLPWTDPSVIKEARHLFSLEGKEVSAHLQEHKSL
jgi:hypothetical protein